MERRRTQRGGVGVMLVTMLLLLGGTAHPAGAQAPRVGKVVVVEGQATKGNAPRGKRLLPWMPLEEGTVLRLAAGARVVVALDRGQRLELTGPIVVTTRADTLVRREGSGSVRSEGSLPPRSRTISPVRPVMAGMLRGDFRLVSPTPSVATAEVPAVVAWADGPGQADTYTLAVRTERGAWLVKAQKHPSSVDRVVLPATLPRGTWLRVSVSASAEGRIIGETERIIRILTEAEANSLQVMREAAIAEPNDPELTLLLVEQLVSLHLLHEAKRQLAAVPQTTSPGVRESARVLENRIGQSRNRFRLEE
ncbi:MAG: hypothetical protein FJX77_12360 [Armatimonadetes bacterium]|nr:hypothetical protein [Armatimonadota bacterium]